MPHRNVLHSTSPAPPPTDGLAFLHRLGAGCVECRAPIAAICQVTGMGMRRRANPRRELLQIAQRPQRRRIPAAHRPPDRPQPRTTIARRRFNQLSYSRPGSGQSATSWRRSPSSMARRIAAARRVRSMTPAPLTWSQTSMCSEIHADWRGTGMHTDGRYSSAGSGGNNGHGEDMVVDSSAINISCMLRIPVRSLRLRISASHRISLERARSQVYLSA